MAAPRTQGFTLLEVIIAVVILAIGLSSLFTSQAGAIRVAQRARTTTVATLLARCKMGEIEERIGKEGWPGDEFDGDDECCEGAEHAGYSCEWAVERIVLPEIDAETDEEDALAAAKEGTAEAAEGAAQAAPDPMQMAQSLLTEGGSVGGALPSPGGEPSGILSKFSGGEGGGGGDPLASMAMQLTYPIIKPVIEEGVRRATVTVKWKEGSSEQSLKVVQYLVNELPIILPGEEDGEEEQQQGAAGGSGGTGKGEEP
jgi:general secretion pathway protein I